MWAEPYLCDSLLVTYAGHVVFDYSIPLGYILYVVIGAGWPARVDDKTKYSFGSK